METITYATPVGSNIADVTLPEGNFYYQNSGKVIQNSLEADTQQSSVRLSWQKDEGAIDYFEVMRRNVNTPDKWEVIATQLTNTEYEDKTVSPVLTYYYKVRASVDCEGKSYSYTDSIIGHCIQTCKVEGYVRFADGTGIPDVTVAIESSDRTVSQTVKTDDSGYFMRDELPYLDQSGNYSIQALGTDEDAQSISFTTKPGGNYIKDIIFRVSKGYRFESFVLYTGTNIPVKGAKVLMDGHEVRTASKAVESDHEGKLSFWLLGGEHTIQVWKEGHKFIGDHGIFTHDFKSNKSQIYFYDDTRVKLIGRVAGGKDQGAIPLGNSLSRNNLGDSLHIVMTLEGDNISKLVFDNTDRSKKERKEVYTHTAHDTKYTYQTLVHTTQKRIDIYPDKHTGEYELLLPPVKWKIMQITAEGYPTLFQEGKTGDVIDLTDSLTLHTDEIKGAWVNINKDTIYSVKLEYNAKYSRIYHTPIQISYKQLGFGKFDYLGEQSYWAQNLLGEKEKVSLAYQVKKENWPADRKDGFETKYTFGHPVFYTDRNYPLLLSATETYYWNNDEKSETKDIVKLSGGTVTVRNGLVDGTSRETVDLDENGEGTYYLTAKQTPYIQTGTGALQTVTFTLKMDGVYYEATPIKAYTFNQYKKKGAKDYFSATVPILVDVLRDPPGGGSSAKLSKGSTLKMAYQMDMSWKAGLTLGITKGPSLDYYSGVIALAAEAGLINTGKSDWNTTFDLMFSGSGQRAFSYTMTANEDISTDAGNTMVGADADVYMGVVTNQFTTPAIAVRAITEKTFKQKTGELKAGRMVEIACGYDEKGDTIHLVRDEVVGYGQKVTSTFTHSQKYILKQLIPNLANQSMALMFVGSPGDAKKVANSTGKRVYLSLRSPNDENFGIFNTDSITKQYVYNSDKIPYEGKSKMNYIIVVPDDDDDSSKKDEVKEYADLIAGWFALIQQNEQEKLEATDLVKNFDMDGGSSITYSEDFSTEYTNSHTFVNPFTSWINNYFAYPDVNEGDTWTHSGNAAATFAGLAALVGPTVGKILSCLLKTGSNYISGSAQENKGTADNPKFVVELKFGGSGWKLSFNPVIAFSTTPKQSETTKYNRKESFTIKMDKNSHLNFDVYRVKTIDTDENNTVTGTRNGNMDVFVETNMMRNVTMVKYFLDHMNMGYSRSDFVYPKSFVYRTRGGATVRPYEGERKTVAYHAGTLLDEKTRRVENPIIKMDKQSISGVPYGEPARFKLYMTNDSEAPEAAYPYFYLRLNEMTNPKGAKLMLDGMPLTGNDRVIEVRPGVVTEKTLEVYASEDFDYENLQLRLVSQGDVNTYQDIEFSVHFMRTAGTVAISTPGDKWILNTDAARDIRGYYMPVVIGGFNKNQPNFDHIEFQYKETTRGDDYWTNLCAYYKDSTLYAEASGTKEMIPENGFINTKFHGEGDITEKAYDLRAVLFCRNGNDYLTNASKVLSGIKDTRRPVLFDTPQPKNSILGAGDNIVFDFSELIEHNYLSSTANFEVVGETNETDIQEEPSLRFEGKGYAQSQARRNFTDKSVTVDLMIKSDESNEEMPIFSHGTDGHVLQLWLTPKKTLKAVVEDRIFESKVAINGHGFQNIAMVLNNDTKQLELYNDTLIGRWDSISYRGYGPIIFGSTNQTDVSKRKFYKGRMLEARIWNRPMTAGLLSTYGKRQLTGFEMGLTDYYPLNEGEGQLAQDKAQGADLTLTNTSWSLPRGMSLALDWSEQREVKGLQLKPQFMSRDAELDYTLMFYFKTNPEGRGAILSNGSGRNTDVDAQNRYFIGFEGEQLKYRSNGMELVIPGNYSDNGWHHYAMTVNRAHNIANIYVDNQLRQSFRTDSLGGMAGDNCYIGNMVWYEKGDYADVRHQQNALTGFIDELCLFKQALPPSLIKRYSTKSPRGNEKGLITYLNFNRQERNSQNDLVLQPYALSQVILRDMNGNETDGRDTVFVDSVKYILSHINQDNGAPVQPYEELSNLSFNYVGRENQLMVNIKEQDARINKRNVYVTLYDIPDLNGNYMASPTTSSFFVDRNPLRWEKKVVTEKFRNDEYMEIPVTITNTSGAPHTYTINGLPRWMTVSKTSDIIDPQSEDRVVFYVNNDINIGTYDEIIYLTDENDLSEPVSINLTIETFEPDWYVMHELKRYSMNLVGQVTIGDAIVTDSRDIVAAFDSNERCMGRSYIDYDTQTGRSMVYMTIYDSTAVATPLTFRLWHHDTGKVMQLKTSRDVSFNDQAIVGSTKEPIIMTANERYIQNLRLIWGWNWVSFNVYNSELFENITNLLNKYTWEEGDILVDDTNGLTLGFKNGHWMLNKAIDINSIMISNARSYRIRTQNTVEIQIEGSALTQTIQRTITVKPGWNSIGYTPMVNLPISTALADYWSMASDGDVIKNQNEFAMFTEDKKGSGEWMGSLKYMKPGEGYMLHRLSETTVQFRYPYYEAGATYIESGTKAPMMRAASQSTTMVMVAQPEGVELGDSDKLVAYSGGEVCGEASALDGVFYISISGDIDAPLSYAIERDGEIIATTGEIMNYVANGVSGSPKNPTKISFVRTEQLPQDGWYTVQGTKLQKRPTQSGVYIYNGKKQIIR